jgi:hypothetical protein
MMQTHQFSHPGRLSTPALQKCQKLASAQDVPVPEWFVCGVMNAGFAALNADSALPFILNRDIQVGGCICSFLNTALAHSTSQAIQ